MWTTACPGCAAPVALSLASPERVTCRHCGFDGAPSDDVQQRLRAAQQVLVGLDVRERQLDERRRRAAAGADLGLIVFFAGIGLLLLLAPVYLCGGLLGLGRGDPEAVAFGCSCSNMTATLLLVVPLVARRMARARRDLLEHCAALPPEAEGEPSRCHVCGAGLAAEGAAAVVRCPHCEADNVVSTEALARARERRVADVDSYEALVREQADTTTAGRGLMNVWLVMGVMWAVHVMLAPLSILAAFGLVRVLHG